jgi:hypothetical protein
MQGFSAISVITEIIANDCADKNKRFDLQRLVIDRHVKNTKNPEREFWKMVYGIAIGP